MKKLFLVAAVALFAGCVSTSKYKKLETDKKAEIDALSAKLAQLETEHKMLTADKEALEAANKANATQYQALIDQLATETQQGQLQITQFKNMLRVDVSEQLFFASGSAKLKKSGQDVLKKVAPTLAQYSNKVIRVVGHTDNVPMKSAQFPTNWELSVNRATNVVRFLQEAGINPANLIATGRGEYDPVAPNDTVEGRQKNRRIEIMLLDKTLAEALQQK